jgi:hypothetical protein
MAAIKALRPEDNLLPSRKQLSSNLLDSCHECLQSRVENLVNVLPDNRRMVQRQE